MKLIYLAILPFIGGCSLSRADQSYYNYPIGKDFREYEDDFPREQEVIDASSHATLDWLHVNYDPKHVLITGNRTEDCDRNDIIGHGVIITIENKDVPSTVKSGVVCIDRIGIRRLQLD